MSSLSITLIQSKLHWEDKKANIEMFESKINAIPGSPELVILPEMFSTGFSMQPEILAEKMDGATVSWMKRMAKSRRIILTGSIIIEEEGKFYNRLIWMLPTGEFAYYDKRHLFAFAKEDEHFTAGSKRLITSAKGWKINVQVCYDLRFPVWSRQQKNGESDNEFDLLIYVANWPEKRSMVWKTLLRARAIENQCFVVGVNRVGKDGNEIVYSGDSTIIDPVGEIIYSKESEEDVFAFQLQKSHLDEIRSKFPFWKDRDGFSISK